MIPKPQVIVEDFSGKNNTPEKYSRFKEMGLYRDLSTVWVTATRGTVPAKVVLSWMQVIGGFNSPLIRIFCVRQRVDHAYNTAFATILSDPILSKYPYILTVEEDNTPPSNGLIKLFESIQEYDAVSGLYWTKGEDGVPQIWGDPAEPFTYRPQTPLPETIQRTNGIGMGFALFRTEMFKDKGFTFGEWFKTSQEPGETMTQDLYFCKKAAELGYKLAVDTRVRVGHYDLENDILW